jgi:hypothetical protein
LTRSFGCVFHALHQRLRNGVREEKRDWLEHAYPKYDMRMIDGTV